MDWDIVYYNEAVQEKVAEWPVGIRACYAHITERMCLYGPNLGMPFTRSLGDGLFEIRMKGKEGIGRAFFCTVIDRKILILHVFIKKSQKIPEKEINIARKRLSISQKKKGS